MNWPIMRLDEIAEIDRSGIDPSTIEAGTKYLGLEHIANGGRIIDADCVSAGQLASTKFRFADTHILYGKLRPYLAKVALPDFSGICSTDILPIRPGPGLDRRYLAYFLRQPHIVELASARSTGVNLPRLSPKTLAEFQVPFPPLPEQTRIAGILERADRIRRKREQALTMTCELLRSVFLDMFGDPVLNTKNLPTIALGELIRVSSGNGLTAKKMDPAGKFPVYGGNGINGFHSDYMFEEPRIVIGRVGVYCGAVHKTEPKAWVTDNALFVRQYKKIVNQTYLEWALRFANLNLYAGRAAQPLISGNRIYPVKIVLPDDAAQGRFSSVVDSQKTLLTALSAARDEAIVLFDSLSQHAFRGEL